jgi:hypothetical protein
MIDIEIEGTSWCSYTGKNEQTHSSRTCTQLGRASTV